MMGKLKFIHIGLWLFMSLYYHWALGQTAGQTRVTVSAVALYQGREDNGVGDNEFRWSFKYNGASTATCHKYSSKDAGWNYPDPGHKIANGIIHNRIPGTDTNNPPLYISMESWEDDKGGDCSFDDGDDFHYGPNTTVATYDLYDEQPPGILTTKDMRKAFTYDSNNKVTYEFSYTPPTPDKPAISGSSPVCVDNTITLTTNTYVNAKFHDQVYLYWEYWIEGDLIGKKVRNSAYCGQKPECQSKDYQRIPNCCFEPEFVTEYEKNWRQAGPTTANVNSGKLSVKLSRLAGLTNLTKRTRVYFRVRSQANNMNGNYSGESSILVDPPSPEFNVSVVQASCKEISDGQIQINVIDNSGGTGKYRYNIQYDSQTGQPDGTSTFEGKSTVISSLPPGNHKVTLSNYRNNAAMLSKCDNTISFTVGEVSAISWNTNDTKITHPTCPDGTGRIDVSVNGGTSRSYIIFALAGRTFSRTAYNKGYFNSLIAGSYTITATDPCSGVSITKNFTIIAPKAITATASTTDPTCSNPNNGKVTVSLSDGPGKYNYQLYLDGKLLKYENNTTAKFHSFTDLASGSNYIVKVYDADRTSCTHFEKTVSLSYTPLSLTQKSKQDILCANGKGSIVVGASGGSGQYQYTLKHQDPKENYQLSNTTGSFTVDRGGKYTAIVKNSGNTCNNTVSITNIDIREPAALAISIVQKNITCEGSYNGKLTATVTGGTSPYTYQWQYRENAKDNWANYSGREATTSEITKLFDSQYRLIVTDKNNCVASSKAYILVDPEELFIEDVNYSHITCQGVGDGHISMVVDGGWGDYTYQYQKKGSKTFTNFTSQTNFGPGTYYVRVVDKEGCITKYDDEVIITEPDAALALAYMVSQHGSYEVSCFGANDGWIEASASGGNGEAFENQYEYALDNDVFSIEPFFTELMAGTHTLKVRDQRGCVVSKTIELKSPPALILSLSEKNYIQCFGDSTGYLTVQAHGGASPYQYRMGAGDWQDTATFTGLPAGAYTFMVRDAQGCSTILTERIESNSPLSIGFTKTDVRCFDEGNGTIKAKASGGKAPYSFNWHHTSSAEDTDTLSQLVPGWYTLTITDAESCFFTDSIQIQQPAAPLSGVSLAIPVRCYGENNGYITLATEGGTLPYQYSLDGGTTFQKDSVFSALQPGNYEILIEDAKGCRFVTQTQIQEPDTLVLSFIEKQHILCHGDSTGSVSVSAEGGNLPYSYSLDNDTFQESPVFEFLPAGAYTLWVKDSKGCQDTVSFKLIEPDAPLALTYQRTMVQCKGSATGAIQTYMSDGTPPYQYNWLTLNKTTANVDNVMAGIHVLEVTDAHGCILRDSITITEPDLPLEGIITEQQNVSCHGLANGSFRFTAQGGYPPYQYAFQGGDFNDVLYYDQLTAGKYTIQIKDTMDCIFTLPIEITQPDPLQAGVDWIDHVYCFGNSDASFQVAVAGGTLPYSYSLDSGNSWQTQAMFDHLSAGEYQAWVKDAHDCQTTVDVVITQPPLLEASIKDVIDASCGQANGSAHMLASGGTLPYVYNWQNQSGITVAAEAYPKALKAGIYTATVTDAKGCQIQLIQTIQDEDGPKSLIAEKIDATCFDVADGSATVIASEGAGDYRYLWSDSEVQTTATAIDLARGTYYVTVTDRRGCVSISAVTIDSPPALAVATRTLTPPLCYESKDGSIEVSMTGGVAPYEYSWSPAVAAKDGKATKLYRGTYTLTVTDAIGCSFTESFELVPPDTLTLVTDIIQVPTCNLGNDGLAKVTASGGTPPYRYLWNDVQKQTLPRASQLTAGMYQVTVMDSHDCQATISVEIPETPPLPVSLPAEVTLCQGQSVTLDASITPATYTWTRDGNVFSNQQIVEITEGGTYQLYVTDTHGCTAEATTAIHAYDTLFEANFLHVSELSTGDTLLLTEVCYPMPDSVRWIFPEQARILESDNFSRTITHLEPGTYQIKLTGYYSVCTDSVTKSVTFVVPEQDQSIDNARVAAAPKGIKSIEVFPNPTTGMFSVVVKLYAKETLYGFLHDVSGYELQRVQGKGKDEHQFRFDIGKYPQGVYLLRLATPGDQQTVRILLQ